VGREGHRSNRGLRRILENVQGEEEVLTTWDEDILGSARRVADAKSAAIQFECIKSHWRQSKDGMTLSLVLSPHDAPKEIILASIGQRFLAVLVPIDDHDHPVVSQEKRDTEDWIRLSGILCKDIEFCQWMKDQGLTNSLSDEECAQAVRDFCGVSSRAQFRENPDALIKWKMLHRAYVDGGTI
jgi:hypothetical protein